MNKLVADLEIGDMLQASNGSVKVVSVFEDLLIESVIGKAIEVKTSDGGRHLLSSTDRVELAAKDHPEK